MFIVLMAQDWSVWQNLARLVFVTAQQINQVERDEHSPPPSLRRFGLLPAFACFAAVSLSNWIAICSNSLSQ
jgi:transcriptional regulator with XRE-family HTH domain